MKHWLVGALVAVSVLAGCSSDSGGESPAAPATTSSASGAAAGSLPLSWTAEPSGSPAAFVLPEEGANPVVAGDLAVVLAGSRATGYDAATGAIAWTASLPATVCASSRTAGDTGVVAVLLGDVGDCRDAAALDTTSGELLWTVPIPRAADGFGHEAAVGPASVVVSAECAGFTVLGLTDGAVIASIAGRTVDGECASAASDGTTVVLSSASRLTTYDAATGVRARAWPRRGLGRVGDVLAEEPLVVSAIFDTGRRLVDLSGPQPRTFGRDAGQFGGEPLASVRTGDVLWTQYDDVDSLVGYDLTTGEETGTVAIGPGARLVGVRDGRLVVTARESASTGVEIWAVDPADPGEPEVLGTMAATSASDGSLAGRVLVGDHVVRLWERRISSTELP